MRAVISSHTSKKWWFRWIRTFSWFSWRYYWFVWLLFLMSLGLLVWCLRKPLEKQLCNAGASMELISRLEDQLEHCCNCQPETASNQPNGPLLPCNQEQASGGAGVTERHHGLGNSPGTVTIVYDMQNQPDKIEVFYEGRLVASSNSIPGNDNGFVGGSNSAGCCNSLSFYYPAREKFCMVRVTGPIGTSWSYTLGCPQ
jgi:hypothetical protein